MHNLKVFLIALVITIMTYISYSEGAQPLQFHGDLYEWTGVHAQGLIIFSDTDGDGWWDRVDVFHEGNWMGGASFGIKPAGDSGSSGNPVGGVEPFDNQYNTADYHLEANYANGITNNDFTTVDDFGYDIIRTSDNTNVGLVEIDFVKSISTFDPMPSPSIISSVEQILQSININSNEGSLNIRIKSDKSYDLIRLVSVTDGKIITEKNSTEIVNGFLVINNLQSGTYMINVINGNELFSRKIQLVR